MKLYPLRLITFTFCLFIGGCEDPKPAPLNMQETEPPEVATDASSSPAQPPSDPNDQAPLVDDQNTVTVSDIGVTPTLDGSVSPDLGVSPPMPTHMLAIVAPESLTGPAGSTQNVEIEVRINRLELPLDGWSFAFSTTDIAHCHISGVSTQSTASAEAESDPIGVVVDGFVDSRVIETEDKSSVLSAVIFSMQSSVKLEPPATQLALIRFSLQATIPEAGSSAQCRLSLSESISIMGRSLESILVSNGEAIHFSMAPVSIELGVNSTATSP